VHPPLPHLPANAAQVVELVSSRSEKTCPTSSQATMLPWRRRALEKVAKRGCGGG